MKELLIVSLLGVGGYAIWKHHHSGAPSVVHAKVYGPPVNQQDSLNAELTPYSDPSGLPTYDDTPIANKPQQLDAITKSNSGSVIDGESGYTPPFGPTENQPDGSSMEW